MTGARPAPCARQTVTAPQALFTMNSDLVEKESEKLAARGSERNFGRRARGGQLRLISGSWDASLPPPNCDYALTYIDKDPARMKELAWLLFNLDEFIYVR